MTRTVFDFLDALDGTPSVSNLGGEHTIYASAQELTQDTRVVEVAVALCADWAILQDQAAARALLIDAAKTIPVLAVSDLYNVLLCSENSLPHIAHDLECALRTRAVKQGYERDSALEGWTRLALGKWTKNTLPLRAMLYESSESLDATEPLVRALGAACSMWRDSELIDAMNSLACHDSLGSDAAMELGFLKVASAVACTDFASAQENLNDALQWFEKAHLDDARSDAYAFHAVLTAVVDCVGGQSVPTDQVDAITDAVYFYLDGYRSVQQSWRGARAGTTSTWLDLIRFIQVAETDGWFDTDTTLRALAHAFAAEQTMVLVVNPGTKATMPQVGVRELVWPRIQKLAHDNSSVISHIERWLTTNTEPTETATRTAVEALLDRLKSPSLKKGHSESVRLPDSIRENWGLTDDSFSELEYAAASEPALVPFFNQIALQSPGLNHAEEMLLDSLLRQCDEHIEGRISAYRTELTVILTDIIRYSSIALNTSQSPSRRPPWITSNQPWPLEQALADDLNKALKMIGRDSYIELPNIAGGRVDIAVKFNRRCTLYIEVKTVDQDRSDEDLVNDFGIQAIQYAVSDVPVAILIVADYTPRKTRRDLTGVFNVTPMRLDPTSRQHALVTVRLQANVAPPSSTSAKRITRKKLAGS